jgi:hypothetical protein
MSMPLEPWQPSPGDALVPRARGILFLFVLGSSGAIVWLWTVLTRIGARWNADTNAAL